MKLIVPPHHADARPAVGGQHSQQLVRRLRMFIAVVGGLIFLLPIQSIISLAAPDRPSRIGMLYLRTLLWGLRCRVEARGTVHANSLVVANHISWTDILVLGSLRSTRFVAKAEVRGWPLLGFLARLNGTLFVERDARRHAKQQIAEVKEALMYGPVALFPEGTTGCGTEVLAFKPALFAAASHGYVQPVSLHYRPRGRDWFPSELGEFAWDGDKAFWPHFLKVTASRSIECLVIAHPPMPATQEGRKHVAEDCRKIIADALVRTNSEVRV